MKSIFRIYAKTSKGNDSYLFKQLHSLNKVLPKYDQYLNAFYFNANWSQIFDVSFKCLSIEQMYVQIGQKFKIVNEAHITEKLQNLPFKNFIPIQRGLVQNTTLNILIKQSSHMPSQAVLTSLITNNFDKQVIKKQYYKQIQPNNEHKSFITDNPQSKILLETKRQRNNSISYFDIKDAVEKKWWIKDLQEQEHKNKKILELQKKISDTQRQLLIEQNNVKKKQLAAEQNSISSNPITIWSQIQQTRNSLASLNSQLQNLQQYSSEKFLSQQFPYHPHLIFYIRKNTGRFLLKINKDNLYKHGWKSHVNWGPIRESIAATILHQSKVLQMEESATSNQQKLKIWDPMCGSGTFGLVATTMLQELPVRSNAEKLFQWMNWPVYKEQYLKQYWKQKESQKKTKQLHYQIVLSDHSRQTINYSIDNFRKLLEGTQQYFSNNQTKQIANHPPDLFPNKTPLSQVLQLVPNKIGFACGDFQQIVKILKSSKQSKAEDSPSQQGLTIITNLPYLHSRSQQNYPLNQLKSIYSRFSLMISQNSQMINNAFVIVDKNILDKNHFLSISQQKWHLIGDYLSGGLKIGLYAWSQNKIKNNFEDSSLTLHQTALSQYENIKGEVTSKEREIILKKQKTVGKALLQYRKKVSEIDRKYYRLPKHLIKTAKGWRRILEKRRRRHLLSAYELFSRRRDKLMAFQQYAHKKLQIKMIKRGTAWKNKNLRYFNHSQEKLLEYSDEIKDIFEKKIEKALKKEEEIQQRRKIKKGDKIQVAKINNKWNNDERKMINQIKNSKGFQTSNGRRSFNKLRK